MARDLSLGIAIEREMRASERYELIFKYLWREMRGDGRVAIDKYHRHVARTQPAVGCESRRVGIVPAEMVDGVVC